LLLNLVMHGLFRQTLPDTPLPPSKGTFLLEIPGQLNNHGRSA